MSSWANVGARIWDVVVVGAGPAGAMTALELSRAGLEVLVVDRAAFPRRKVCGACLSRGALEILSEAGLADLAERAQAVPLTGLRVSGWGRTADLPLRGAAALSRAELDQALITAVIDQGGTFVDRTRAMLGPETPSRRTVSLRRGDAVMEVTARVVVDAGGLGSRLLAGGSGPSREMISPTARVGLGRVFEDAPAWYAPGTIYMAVAGAGYVGLVRQEDGTLNLAAAVDPDPLRASTPEAVTSSILLAAHFPPLGTQARTSWQGTPALTRKSDLIGAERVFLVGDSAGYVEPFTGEGICWALGSARALAPLVVRATRSWDPGLLAEWREARRRGLVPAQRLCRAVSSALRRPTLTRTAIGLLGACPSLAAPMLERATHPPSFHRQSTR